MRISIIGTNGMLSISLTKSFVEDNHHVIVYGLRKPDGYKYSEYYSCDLLNDALDYDSLIKSDLIVYASGAGVQAALSTSPHLMYALNVNIPINITLELKKRDYKGVFISFGSYMEIGLNDENHTFNEEEIVCSPFPVTNDYALSKRLFSRYMHDFRADYTYWHFILPNMFSYNDILPGTRLIPYVLQYCRQFIEGCNPQPPTFSSGVQKRQYILLEEIKNVIYKSFESKMVSGIYNIGGGEFGSIRSFIEKLFGKYGVPCRNDFFGKTIRRDGDIGALKLDGRKLYGKINYLPSTRMVDIL